MGLTAVCGSTTRQPVASNSTPLASPRAILLDVIRVSIIYPDPEGAGTKEGMVLPAETQRRRVKRREAESKPDGRRKEFGLFSWLFSTALISASLRLCGEAYILPRSGRIELGARPTRGAGR